MDATAATFSGTIALWEDARYEDIARRLLMHQPLAQIAQAHDVSDRQLHRLLRNPRMTAIYEKVKGEILGDVDRVMTDEKVAPLLRARAQAVRAQTAMAEVMEMVRERVTNRTARVGELRVLTDVAFGIMDRSSTELAAPTRGGGNTKINVNVGVPALSTSNAEILRDAMRESGVDLSYLDAVIVEAPTAPTENENVSPTQEP